MMRGGGRGRRGTRRRTAMRHRRMAVRMTRRRRRRRRRRRILLVGGLVAYGAYKMSKKDAERIEEHTGTSPEEMTDEELDRAMQELDIEKQYRDESDMAEAGQEEYEDEYIDDEPSYLDELERLAKLKDQGVITEEEFETKKKEILDS